MFTDLSRSRSLLRAIARLMVGALLFAQGLMAAHACDLMIGGVLREQVAAPAAHCHEGPAPIADVLCVKHCNANEQSPSTPSHAVAPMPAIAVLTVPALLTIEQSGANGIATATLVSPATDPPPAILFHAFRS